jgi:hypothetical protein
MENNEVKKETTATKEKLVEIGPIPYDMENPSNKYQMISVNGDTIMLERGQKHKVPERFANAYEHRMNMAGRKIRERERKAQELRDKQNQEGVSFL